MSIRMGSALTILAAALGSSVPAMAQMNSQSGAQAVHQLSNQAGTSHAVTWGEVEPAAKARFKELDTNHDGTLSEQEAARAGITQEQFRQAASKSGSQPNTLSEQEYLSLVKNRFEAAGLTYASSPKLTKQQFDSPAGEELLSLLDLNSTQAASAR